MKVALSTAALALSLVGCNKDQSVEAPDSEHTPIPADLKHLTISAHIPGQRFTPTSSGGYAFDGVTGSVCKTFYNPDDQRTVFCDHLFINYPDNPPSPTQNPVKDHLR